MLVAMTAVGLDTLLGRPPTTLTVLGALLCVALAAVHRWITAREEQRTGARLRRSEAWFRSLVSSGSDGVVLLDDELRVTWTSPSLERVLRGAAAPLIGRPLVDAVHPADAPALAAALDTPRPDAGLVPLRLQDDRGTWRWLEAGTADLRDDPTVGAVVLHCRDVTERHEREEALHSVAYTDPITGLPNRAGILRVLERALAEQDGAPVAASAAFLLIELDGLAEAREHTGREAVTAVEAEVGRRLRSTVREDDVVARLGGGAFAILAHETATDADQLAHRCLAVVEQPIVTDAGIVELTAAVGLVGLEAGVSVAELTTRAELAVRAARVSGAGSATRYVPALGEAAARRDRLRTDLQGARDRGELFLLFQPIVSLTEQRITGVEALLRWRHPTLGDVPPTEFLPIAERAGLIADLERWALEEAMTATASLPSSGAPLRLGINVPAAYAAGGTLVADVEAALAGSGFGAELLVLEIPEATVLSGDERVALDITTLRLMGVHVALDDFGAGDASLASLTRLPIDILKLDRSFVARVDRDRQSRALCESVVGIGRALGLDVVAEGVETPGQLGILCGFGAGFAQGFLISRPMPLLDLARLLEERDGALWPGLVGSR
jgi:diguanylate cyclase (GGDEF)-like protein/PAS domain S-box-containing protein